MVVSAEVVVVAASVVAVVVVVVLEVVVVVVVVATLVVGSVVVGGESASAAATSPIPKSSMVPRVAISLSRAMGQDYRCSSGAVGASEAGDARNGLAMLLSASAAFGDAHMLVAPEPSHPPGARARRIALPERSTNPAGLRGFSVRAL